MYNIPISSDGTILYYQFHQASNLRQQIEMASEI